MIDVSFRSAALQREMHYRVLEPAEMGQGQRLSGVYLLHGGGGSFRDWTNYSDVAVNTANDSLLILPEGDDSYYTNSATLPQDRYEDYIVQDLISDVEQRFPVLRERNARAVVGVSTGGYGAVKIALHHPEVFGFVGAMSPALDVPSRAFSPKRISQWRHHRSIFGPFGGDIQNRNDPYILARNVDSQQAPYFYLTCGDGEGLLDANRQFAKELHSLHFNFEFHTVPGGHDWNQWNTEMPALFQSLREHLTNQPSPALGRAKEISASRAVRHRRGHLIRQ